MTQYYSRTDIPYAGDSNFTIPFSYIDKNDINVFVNDESITTWTWLNDSQINVTSTLTTGDIISIRRNTPIDEKIVAYQNMSMVLNDDNLNLSQDQILNAVQEIYDNNIVFKDGVDADIATINTTANTALTNSQTAISTANSAETKADSAVSTANTANSTASTALSTANTASTNASSAVSTANSAASDAASAVTTANSANSKADTAISTANTAKNTADTAKSTADTALSNSQTALSNSQTAVSTANTASSNASNAVSTANSAASDASSAVTTANSASSLASDTKDRVDAFAVDIASVISAADKINQLEEAVTTATTAASTASTASSDAQGYASTASAKADIATQKAEEVAQALSSKQDKLTAGTDLEITQNNTINFTNNSKYIKNTANGTGSITINGTATNGNNAVNIGNGAYTAGYAVSIGNSASSNGGYSISIGSGANTYGASSVAIGRGAKTNSTSAENALALGRQAEANASGAIQLGKGTNTTANSMAVGFADIDGEGTSATYPLLDGTTGFIPDARISTSFVKTSNIDQTYDGTSANAQSGVAIAGAGFIANTATGTSALTINGTATAKTQAINIGTLSQATANYGTTVGAYSYANGSKSSAFGNYARATADRAIQIGQGTNSTADTLQIGFDGTSYQLLDGTTGLIPDARISSNFISINNIDDSLKGTLSHTSPVQIVNLGSNSWQNIIYGANEYVAIGQTGYVSTSSDGTNWTVASSILGNNDWGGGIAYNSNYFVALSADSYISHSNDGVNWDTPYIDTNLSTAQNWHSLVYDGTKFVAMSNAGYVSTSTDGYTWTQAAVVSNLNSSRGLYMGYGNGIFIAIDSDGKIATSNDGTNWTIPTSTNLFASYADSIVYCSGRFVVLSEYGEIYTSFDGENWIYATDLPYSSTYGHWRSLAVNSNQILAISEKGYIASVQISSQLSPSFPYIINSGVIGNTYFREWSDGTLEQWNYRKSSSTAGTQSITYPISFTSEPMLITTYTLAASATTSTTTRNYGYNTSKTGFDVYLAANGRLAWYARGY